MPPRRTLQIRSAKELVTAELRALIESGEIAGGERLSIEELAESFGLSRTPVRDGLMQLSTEGLVTILPRVGVFVRQIEDQHVLDVYEMKRVLEPLMAELAAERASAEERKHFLEAVDELEAAAAADDVDTYVALLETHRGQLQTMCHSEAMRDTFQILDGRVRPHRNRYLSQPGQLARSARLHRVIAQAVHDGDGAEAGEASRVLLEGALEHVRSRLRDSQSAGQAEPEGSALADG